MRTISILVILALITQATAPAIAASLWYSGFGLPAGWIAENQGQGRPADLEKLQNDRHAFGWLLILGGIVLIAKAYGRETRCSWYECEEVPTTDWAMLALGSGSLVLGMSLSGLIAESGTSSAEPDSTIPHPWDLDPDDPTN